MKTAFISDIHGNLAALESVLKHIDSVGVDEICCLGDIVGYGPCPNECVEIVRKRCSIVLMGNHDAAALDVFSTQNFNLNAKIAIEWTSRTLSPSTRSYLTNLPMIHSDDMRTLVHATPYEPRMWYYITSLEEAAFNFQFFSTRFCFVGHTHIPVVITLAEGRTIEVLQETTIDFSANSDQRHLVNIGSVGQPRDRNPNASYAVFDSDTKTLYMHRVPYDVQTTQDLMRAAALPEFLISRLAEGR